MRAGALPPSLPLLSSLLCPAQVIETSGVTEPQRIIQALDQRFGKMTRARLDSVVTLLDADAVYHQHVAAQPPQPLPLSMRSQLQVGMPLQQLELASMPVTRVGQASLTYCGCVGVPLHMQHADVVVLNKIDLLPQSSPHAYVPTRTYVLRALCRGAEPCVGGCGCGRVEAVESLVRAVNAHARLHRATYGDVPLPLLLDVELPDAATPSTLTHEVAPCRRINLWAPVCLCGGDGGAA